jgi:hypothetical protein
MSILSQAEHLETRVDNLLRQNDLRPDLDLNEEQENLRIKTRFGIRDEINKIERSVQNKLV